MTVNHTANREFLGTIDLTGVKIEGGHDRTHWNLENKTIEDVLDCYKNLTSKGVNEEMSTFSGDIETRIRRRSMRTGPYYPPEHLLVVSFPYDNLYRGFGNTENLAAQKLSNDLHKVMKEVIQIVNFIKAKALNSRLFSQMCSDFDSTLMHLLYHSEVRWLSRGKVLQRLLDLRTETEMFLTEKKHQLAHKFSDSNWLMQVAYLADIFAEINSLNMSIQGRDQTLVELSEKLSSFEEKLKLWMNKVKAGKTASFPSLNILLENENYSLSQVQDTIVQHMSNLVTEFDHYIPENAHKYSWIRNPFNIEAEDLPEEMSNINNLQEQLIEIQSDETLQYDFKRQHESLSSFWIKMYKEKPILGGEAMKALLLFATTHLCEAGFSALTLTKTKYRNRLQPEDDKHTSVSRFSLIIRVAAHYMSSSE
ncbi:protein FAM200B-like [Macrobrachium nipponense]|uniref:protein FAM200B-like n=1 Tax=Macrobrachium nipponense TaxID=159736 RepID=UPI0030C83010